jgi:hypothetical protein
MSREPLVFHSKIAIVKVNGEVPVAGQNQENRGLGGLAKKAQWVLVLEPQGRAGVHVQNLEVVRLR